MILSCLIVDINEIVRDNTLLMVMIRRRNMVLTGL